jgi:hypothetical protein
MFNQQNKRHFCNLTLNEILTLCFSLAVPAAIIIYAAITTQQEAKIADERYVFESKQAAELRQQQIYDEFLDDMYKLDKDEQLNPPAQPWAFANARYRAVHRQCDSIRKSHVLRFLREKDLIGRHCVDLSSITTDKCQRTTEEQKTLLPDIIRLNELDFDDIQLKSEIGSLAQLNMTCVRFEQVSMSNSIFSHTNLDGALFDRSRFNGAKFENASLMCATFHETELDNTNFISSNLQGTLFSNVNLSSAKFTQEQILQANFSNATMPEGLSGRLMNYGRQ